MSDRADLTRWICWLLVLAAVATAGGLMVALPSLPSVRVPPATRADRSDLVREFPLGKQPLCCSKGAPARRAVASTSASRRSRGGDGGSDASAVLVPALAIFAALALLGWARRFSRRDGLWMRRRQRRRWRVGLRAYRLAQTLGFGYSHSRDALVPKVGNGAFGPVLRLRRSDVASHRPPGTLDGRSARTTHRPAASPFPHPAPELPTSTRSRSTVDVACLPFPHADRDAGLWQLTAVELGSRFVWAELVGPHVERPAAQELAAFVRRVAADLWGADQLLGTLVVHAAPPGLFDRGLLPTGVRLLALARNTTRTQVAAEIHDQLAERDGYSRLAADASFAELSRWLQSRVAALNATNGAEPTVLGHAR